MKRRLITFYRVVRTGCINFVRNFTLSVAATAVMVITLTIVLFSVIANATFNNTIEDINSKIDISIYLKDSVTEDQRNHFIAELSGLENVEAIEYLSKDQVLEQYREDNKDNIDLLLAISQTDNPLPATIKIDPVDPSKNEEIKQVVENQENLKLQSDDTSYSGDRKEAIDKITHATSVLQRAVLIGIIVFGVISMLIIFNTIQMAIFNRREELRIMRLLGATPWYIRGPFIVETMVYGIISAIISIMLGNSLFTIQDQAFAANSLGLLDMSYASEYFADNFWKFFGGLLLAGMTIGAISALIATKRYLKMSNPTGGVDFRLFRK